MALGPNSSIANQLAPAGVRVPSNENFKVEPAWAACLARFNFPLVATFKVL